jgi:hypothetical protein
LFIGHGVNIKKTAVLLANIVIEAVAWSVTPSVIKIAPKLNARFSTIIDRLAFGPIFIEAETFSQLGPVKIALPCNVGAWCPH